MAESGIERAARLAADLPQVEIALWYGKPALKVAGKGFVGSGRVEGAIALPCPLESKAHLIETQPGIFFETDHYKGWPWLLVRLDPIDDETLRHRIEVAWMLKAPRKLVRQFEAASKGVKRGLEGIAG